MSTVTEIEDHAAHRATIEALFKAAPFTEIQPDVLRAITPHYQQRISELRKSGLTIENRPRHVMIGNRKKRLDGAYRYLPYVVLGRDASTPDESSWPVPGAPYTEPFRLT